MYYYMKLDKNKEFLEIKQSKSINSLTKELKVNGGTINEYLDGPSNMLSCGVKMPLMKAQTKELYLISELKEYLEFKNYKNMSKEVIDDISCILSFRGGYEGMVNK